MPRLANPPTSLRDQKYFVLRYSREWMEYELVMPKTAESYNLGTELKARQYFWTIGMQALGERAMDAARNFGTSQAIVAEGRAFGLDLTNPKVDRMMGEQERRLRMQKLIGDPEDEDDVVL